LFKEIGVIKGLIRSTILRKVSVSKGAKPVGNASSSSIIDNGGTLMRPIRPLAFSLLPLACDADTTELVLAFASMSFAFGEVIVGYITTASFCFSIFILKLKWFFSLTLIVRIKTANEDIRVEPACFVHSEDCSR